MKNGIYPAKKTLFLFCIPVLFILSAFLFDWMIWAALGINIIIILLLLLDGFISPNYKKKTKISLLPPGYLKINSNNNIDLHVVNHNRMKVRFYFILDLDYSFERNYARKLHQTGPLQESRITVKIFAKRRGQFQSKAFCIKGISSLGLLYFYHRQSCSTLFHVVPFVDNIQQTFKINQKKIKRLSGIQKSKATGDGTHFEMLREYQKGDEFNKIDWKASSRNQKPVTRIYCLENSLEIAMMIDCGRLMATEVKGMSLLDYAVNTAMVLSQCAVKGNDKLSLTCFANDIIKYLPPFHNKKEMITLNYLLTDIQYHSVESNYQIALSFIKQKLSKRSMIIFLTDIIDDSNIQIYHQYFSALMKKHMILLVLLRDKNLFNIGKAYISHKTSIYEKAAAADLILRRNKTIHDLKKLGVHILDLYPEQVTAKVISKYVELKSRN